MSYTEKAKGVIRDFKLFSIDDKIDFVANAPQNAWLKNSAPQEPEYNTKHCTNYNAYNYQYVSFVFALLFHNCLPLKRWCCAHCLDLLYHLQNRQQWVCRKISVNSYFSNLVPYRHSLAIWRLRSPPSKFTIPFHYPLKKALQALEYCPFFIKAPAPRM